MQEPKQRINLILLFILIVGAFLRFYGFPHIPFTYDELSAWGRTGYSSFYDLINQGVRGDGHPALIQVFLNYWRKIFGDSEASFKLPFLIMGLCCICLVFEIGRSWFNETVGIICAAFIAVLQFTVEYSQIARPYISGLFFSLMMVHYWSKYVFGREDTKNRKPLIAFAIFALLCCYNHYFSLLFAIIVGISGFFFLPIKKWSDYSLAGIAVLLLFLPHFEITMDQFAIGGVGGWLAKPDRTFFGNYLSYIFDFSWWVKGMVILLVILSVLFISKDWRQKNKLRFGVSCVGSHSAADRLFLFEIQEPGIAIFSSYFFFPVPAAVSLFILQKPEKVAAKYFSSRDFNCRNLQLDLRAKALPDFLQAAGGTDGEGIDSVFERSS